MANFKSHIFFVFALLYALMNSSYFYCNADEKCIPAVPSYISSNRSEADSLMEPFMKAMPFPIRIGVRGIEDEDIYLNITQLLTKYGYSSEEHVVETSDGYLLKMIRIPSDGPMVFVMHGFLCSSDDFVTTGPRLGLAYLLANAKYDVWLGNARGNKHSRKHVTLSPDCAEFWQFTWDEIGRYDLPAMIDYALNVTGKTKLAFVGHSQGCTSYFVMAAVRPEYSKKVSIAIMLSAVVYVGHTSNNLIRLISPFTDPLNLITDIFGIHEFGTRGVIINTFTKTFCGTPLSAALVCLNILYIFDDFDYILADFMSLPVIFGHYPAGASTNQAIHYGQIYNAKEFRRFNMGIEKNLKVYGSVTPPNYPLENVTGKMVIFYSDNDSLATKPDLKKLLSELTNDVEIYRLPRQSCTHYGFIYARDIDTLVNYKVIEYIRKNHD